MKLWVVILGLMASFSFGALASPQLILKMVGSVDSRVLTNRDVQQSHFVDVLLFETSKPSIVSMGTPEFSESLNRLLIETMVFNEAKSFGVAQVNETEIEQSYRNAKEKLQKAPSIKSQMAALGINDSSLKEMITRKLRANRFVKYKSNSSFVQATDEEAREYFNKNRMKFGTMDFAQFRTSIRTFLSKRNAEERLKEWFDVLRRKYHVQNTVAGPLE